MPVDFELLIVDNGSSDHTREVLEKFKPPFEYRILFEPLPGLGRARNTGWKASTGDVIAFTDDDCYVQQDFAQSIIALFELDATLDWFTGRILLHNPAHARLTIREDTEAQDYPAKRFLKAGDIRGANFGFRRAVLETLDGFDPTLGAGTPLPAEDIEFVGRAVAKGYRGVYAPEPTVRHDHGRGEQHAAELMRKYDIGRGAYYAAMISLPEMRVQAIRTWIRQTISLNPARMIRKLSRLTREIGGAVTYVKTRPGRN